MHIYEAILTIDSPDYNFPCITENGIEFKYVDNTHRKHTRYKILVQARNPAEARQKIERKVKLSKDSQIYDIQYKLLDYTVIL